ncbi:MAG: NUDIX domain-containing protein [Chloroflexota bacterium]
MPYTYEYPRPTVTTDAVVFRNNGNQSEVLLIQRGQSPFKGMWAIPGGFIDLDEELIDSAKRELKEETGLVNIPLKEFGVYGKVGRDPRHRTITVAFAGLLDIDGMKAVANDDAAACEWFKTDHLPELAFDHDVILKDAINFGRNQGWIN